MVPARYNFQRLYEGDTYDGIRITVETVAHGVTTPVDISDIEIVLQARSAEGELFLTLYEGAGGINKVDPTLGVFHVGPFVVPAAGYYDYDIQFTYPDLAVKTYMAGRMIVEEGVVSTVHDSEDLER